MQISKPIKLSTVRKTTTRRALRKTVNALLIMTIATGKLSEKEAKFFASQVEKRFPTPNLVFG